MLQLLLTFLGCGPEVPPTGGDLAATPMADAGPDRVGYVGEPVSFEGAATGGEVTWTFGDGASAEGLSVLHAYDAPGHYMAMLDADGVTDAAAVTIVYPPLDPPPRASSVVARAGERLFVALPDLDAVAVVDLPTGSVSHLPTCAAPRSVDALGDTIAVACASDTVEVYRWDGTLRERHVLPWGSAPFGVVVSAPDRIRVTLQGEGALWDAGAIEPVGPDLRGLAVVGDQVLVSRHRSPDEGGMWWSLQPEPVVHHLALDPGPDSDTDARGVPTYLQRIAVRPDGRAAVLGGLKANIERGQVRDGRPLTHETTVRADLRQVSLPEGTELSAPKLDDRDLVSAMAYHPRGDWLYLVYLGARRLDVLDAYTMARSGGVGGLGHAPDGVLATDTALYVVASGSRALHVFDVSDPASPIEVEQLDLRGDLPDLPSDILWGKNVFHDASDPRMTASGYVSCASCHLDGDTDGRTWDFTDRGEGLRDTIPLLGRGGRSPMHWSANFDEVQDFEHDVRGPMAGEGFLSEEDFAATADPLGLPKAGLAPELDALAAYLGSLTVFPRSPHRAEDGARTEDAVAGEAVFRAAGCPTCHPAPDYTDSAWVNGAPVLHDVGTLGPDSGHRLGGPLIGIDTPTLRGVWATPPYLHDGSAATLREVLVDRNPDDRHGATSSLSEEDLDALVSFLSQLE